MIGGRPAPTPRPKALRFRPLRFLVIAALAVIGIRSCAHHRQSSAPPQQAIVPPKIDYPRVTAAEHRIAAQPAPIETTARTVAIPPAHVFTRHRGGCGSHGGPGYRLPNGRCASWH